MHPIEHLRYVARARGADPVALVRETAHALTSMRFDPSGLVVACRRIVERHPECGPLWWLCARLLTAPDPFELAWTIADEIDADPTARVLADELADDATVVTVGWPELAGAGIARLGGLHVLVVDAANEATGFLQRLERSDVPCDPVRPEALAGAVGHADVVVLEAVAVSSRQAVATVGSAAAAMVARSLGVPVWLVAGTGRRLPHEYVVGMVERLGVGCEPWNRDHEVVDMGLVDHVVGPHGRIPAAAVVPECAYAPELLRTSPM